MKNWLELRVAASVSLQLTILFAMLLVASTVAGSVRFLRPGPGFDFWGAAMPFLRAAAEGSWSWELLWEMSAGAHRLVVPKILFWLEWHLGDFRNTWLLSFAWLALAASALLVLCRVWQDQQLDRYSRGLCLFLVLMGFGTAHHINNLSYAFNLQWSWGLLFSLLFIDGVIQSVAATRFSQKMLYAVIATLAALLLTFTTFSLPVLLGVWIFLAWGLKIRIPIFLPIAIILLLANIAYISYLPLFHDVQSALANSSSSNSPTLIQILVYLGVFVFSYLGSPLSAQWLIAGVMLAMVVIVFIVRSLWLYRISGKSSSELRPLFWLIFAFVFFVVLMAFSTAMGRATDPGAAVSPRFRTFVLPFLALSAVIWVCNIQLWRKQYRVLASISLVAFSIAVVLPGHLALLKQFSDEYDDYVTPTVAMAVGLEHFDVVHEARLGLWWQEDNKMLLGYRDLLFKHRKGIYAEPYFHQLGKHVSLPPGSISKPVDYKVLALPGGGYELKAKTSQCDGYGRIALVDDEWNTVGIGLVKRSLPDASWRNLYRVFLPLCREGHEVGWTAFLPTSASQGAEIFALAFPANKASLVGTGIIP